MADPQTTRQLKIKTGVVKRLHKEEATYAEEVVAAQRTLQGLKDEGADGADIRNAERVVKDSEQMIPRTRASLETALVALKDLVDALSVDAEITATTEYTEAVAAVKAVEAAWAESQ